MDVSDGPSRVTGRSVGDETLAGDVGEPTRPGNEPVAMERGENVGRYVVLELVGEGGMGSVYAAYDPELDRKIALKLMRARTGGGETASVGHRRLQREAQSIARLSHPNVVAVHDVGVHDDQVFIAMEYVDGSTLTDWLESRPRPRPEIVDVFVQAGRGLAAAHGAGLVHRDFKPDNVLVGSDGRVRVTDFGLARDPGETEAPKLDLGSIEARPADVFGELTEAGSFMGTPAYMSPEQHMRLELDARSDQFSYCVALYEALFGTRPFRADNAAALAFQVSQGNVTPPPRGVSVPAHLQRLVLRGLSVGPEDRWPSMDALIAELLRDPGAARRRWLAVGGVAALVVGGVLGARWYEARRLAGLCAGVDAPAAETWNETRQANMRQVIEATGARDATRVAERIVAELTTFMDDWARRRVEACEATRVRGERSEHERVLRVRCLDTARRDVEHRLTVLDGADEGVVTRAVDAMADLPDLARCEDYERLLSDVPPPDDPGVAREVDAIRSLLSRASTLDDFGKYDEGATVAAEALERARAVGHPPVLAEALYGQASSVVSAGDFPRAMELLEDAFFEAQAAGHARESIRAATYLAWVVGGRMERFDEGRRWARQARALLDRHGDSGMATAWLLNNMASIERRDDNLEQALQYRQQALALREARYGKDSNHITNYLHGVGIILEQLGRYDEAREAYERTQAIRERVYGLGHVRVAPAIAGLGSVYSGLGKPERSIDHYRRALEIYERNGMGDHPRAATLLTNIGIRLVELERHEQALVPLRSAYAIRIEKLGPRHARTGLTRRYMGLALAGLGQVEQAEAELRGAVEHLSGDGHDTSRSADALLDLAELLEGREQLKEAAAIYRRAHDIYVDTVGGEGERATRSTLGLGRVLWALGERKEAAALVRSWARREGSEAQSREAAKAWLAERNLQASAAPPP